VPLAKARLQRCWFALAGTPGCCSCCGHFCQAGVTQSPYEQRTHLLPLESLAAVEQCTSSKNCPENLWAIAGNVLVKHWEATKTVANTVATHKPLMVKRSMITLNTTSTQQNKAVGSTHRSGSYGGLSNMPDLVQARDLRCMMQWTHVRQAFKTCTSYFVGAVHKPPCVHNCHVDKTFQSIS
jgi:hypothetical protein